MTLYIKTRKGMDELLARRSTIEHRLNSLLLLVDGTHTLDELQAQMLALNAPADSLEILLHGGYIEAQRAATVYRMSSPARSGVSTVQEASDATGDTSADALQSFYRYLVATARQRLGLRGLGMQLKIVQASTATQLSAPVAPLADAIAKRHGLDATHAFMAEAERTRRAAHAPQPMRSTTAASERTASATAPLERSANAR
ncbi:MAG: hypothetical protein KGJ44_01980 [Betaproteobacteria bacterium]|nr:hypothetical protein [Betaproteobacteria bacterium]